MVNITLEEFWMVSDRIVNFGFFVKFHRSGPAIIFSSWTITEHVMKIVPNQAKIYKDFIMTVSFTREGLRMVSDRIFFFDFSSNFKGPGPAIIFSFWTISEHVRKNVPNQAKIYQDFIMTVSFTLEGLWMVSDRIVNFRFFVKFHRSGPAIIFSFGTISEHISYGSKKLPIKPRFIRTSSRWSVFLWKDYGWFLIELSIFNFFIKFHKSGPAIIFIFWTITEHVRYASKR